MTAHEIIVTKWFTKMIMMMSAGRLLTQLFSLHETGIIITPKKEWHIERIAEIIERALVSEIATEGMMG